MAPPVPETDPSGPPAPTAPGRRTALATEAGPESPSKGRGAGPGGPPYGRPAVEAVVERVPSGSTDRQAGAPVGTEPEARPAGPPPPRQPAVGPSRRPELPPVHGAVICVAAPCLVISPEHGQLTGRGIDGIYRAGRRLLSRCVLRVGGRDPVAVQARSLSADRASFTATVRTGIEAGPDPDIGVERVRHADGTERITLRSFAARPLRLPVEVSLGTDLAELAAVAAGRAGPELAAGVHAAGLRWSTGDALAVTTAEPAPDDVLASAGLLRWQLDLGPGSPAASNCGPRATGRRGPPPDRSRTRSPPPAPRGTTRGPTPGSVPASTTCAPCS